jgi:hypothetical protein
MGEAIVSRMTPGERAAVMVVIVLTGLGLAWLWGHS